MPYTITHGDPCNKCGTTERCAKKHYCIACHREYARQYRRQHPEQALKMLRNWRAANSSKLVVAGAAWAKENPLMYRCCVKANRANWIALNHHGDTSRIAGRQVHAVFSSSTECGICKERFENDSKWSIDHIVAFHKGGKNVIENVQIAHLSCNSRKGNTTDRLEASTKVLTNPIA